LIYLQRGEQTKRQRVRVTNNDVLGVVMRGRVESDLGTPCV